MKKQKTKKKSQVNTTPETYIKTRARNLPIGKCYINKSWKNTGFATVLISRNHSNGNFTFALFLVDIYCLGVKNTFYLFNKHEEFNELLDKLKNQEPVIEIKYALAHNIIYGGIKYAASLGFKPHKEFEITQFLLEVDDGKIKPRKIEFGLKGKPAIFAGREEHPANIIATLERNVGKGNFHIFTMEDLGDNDDNEDNDGNEWYDEEFDEELTDEDLVDIFEGKKKSSPRVMLQMVFVLYEAKCTEKEQAEMQEIANEVKSWQIMDEGQTDEEDILSDEDADIYNLYAEKARQNPQNALLEIETLIAKNPHEYSFHNLLTYAYKLLGEKEKEYDSIVSSYSKFPHKIMAFTNYLIVNAGKSDPELKKLIGKKFDFHQFFPQRDKISFSELLTLTSALFIYFSISPDEFHKAAAFLLPTTSFIFYGENKDKADEFYMHASQMIFSKMGIGNPFEEESE